MADESHDGSATTEQTARAASRFVGLADTLVEDFSVVDLLHRLVADCIDLLDVSEAGVVMHSGDGLLDVVASSSEASYLMVACQVERQDGPCVVAARSGQPILDNDLAEMERRWPALADSTRANGFCAVHAIPLRHRAETIGALCLFSASRPSMSDYDHHLARALADVATIGILQQRSLSRASVRSAQLQLALNTRLPIEQAKGMVAEYGGIDVSIAFVAIRAYARQHRMKLVEVAAALVAGRLDPRAVVAERTRSRTD